MLTGDSGSEVQDGPQWWWPEPQVHTAQLQTGSGAQVHVVLPQHPVLKPGCGGAGAHVGLGPRVMQWQLLMGEEVHVSPLGEASPQW